MSGLSYSCYCWRAYIATQPYAKRHLLPEEGGKNKTKAPFGIVFVFFIKKKDFVYQKVYKWIVSCLQLFHPKYLSGNKK